MIGNGTANWIFRTWASCVPGPPTASLTEWAKQNVKLIGSARSERYDPEITPWTKEPIERCNDGTRKITFVKPIQGGGSVAGEIAILYWLSRSTGGDIQYNWPNDSAADDRWKKRFEKILRACKPAMEKVPKDRFSITKGLVIFPQCNLIMQGIYTDRSVTGDSIRFQVNEEIHDEENWQPGRLQQAYGRTTAFWNSVILNISNAGMKGGQLHQAWLSGTQQRWEVPCPNCGKFFPMHMALDEKNGSGLIYETDNARTSDGDIDYNRLAGSVRYRFECGHEIGDHLESRRRLSLGGRYGAPRNSRASLLERSYTLEAVSVDYIPWVSLIQQKQLAFRSRKFGDGQPWLTYLRERECRFPDPRDRPDVGPLLLSSDRKKDRSGLPDRKFRFAALDRQIGRREAGEMPHWWILIMDFDVLGNGLVVFEGRVDSDGAAVETLRRHELQPWCVLVDSGDDTEHVYDFCLLNGFTAIKLEGPKTYLHADQTRHYWSEPEELWTLARRAGPVSDDAQTEPEFFLASKQGAFELLNHQRANTERKWEVPGDVSEDFKTHFQAWSLEEKRIPATNEIQLTWRKFNERAPDHLFVCASYIALLCDQAELIGVALAEKKGEEQS